MIDKDTIIKLAREAGPGIKTLADIDGWPVQLESFAKAIYRQGLEDAAKACAPKGNRHQWTDFDKTRQVCADEIMSMMKEPHHG